MSLAYSVRPNTFGPETQMKLGDSEIVWTTKRGERRLRYADVSFVRLANYPTQLGPLRQCVLKGAGSKLKIPSLHYRGFGKVDDRVEAYAPFVRELLKRVAASNANVRYQANSKLLWWLYVILLTLLVLVVALLLVITIMEPSAALKTSAPMLALALVGPLMWRYIKSSTRTFDPLQPPQDLIGA